jgi:hypothetical protein
MCAARTRTRAPRRSTNPRSDLGRLADFTAIIELKGPATQIGGLGYGEVVRDFRKTLCLLNAAERDYPNQPLPAAYVGLFAPDLSITADGQREQWRESVAPTRAGQPFSCERGQYCIRDKGPGSVSRHRRPYVCLA